MSTKIDSIIIEDESGEFATVEKAAYAKLMIEKHSVKAIETEQLQADPKKIVDHIIKSVSNGKDVDESVSDAYSDLVAEITSDIERTLGETKSKADQAKEDKEKKEKEKEELKAKAEADKLELTKKQDGFVEQIAAGADLAAGEFQAEVDGLLSGMPEGVKVVSKNGGYGIEVAVGTSADTVGAALGYMMQKSMNSQFIGNQLHFWIGDMVNHTVNLGIYDNASEANKSISKLLKEKYGKSLTTMGIDAYKRMADRTPIELRNPKVDSTAYLAVAGMKLPKIKEGEKKEDFEKRMSNFESDRTELQAKLASGEITSRKDILEPVNEVLYKHELKERPSTDNGPSVVGWLQIFFHTKFALENLDGVHKEGYCSYKNGEEVEHVLTTEIQEKYDEAESNLSNIYYTQKKGNLTARDFIRGYVEEMKEIKVGEDADKKPIKEVTKVKNMVYPPLFYSKPKEEAPKEEAPKEEAAKA